MGDIGFEIDRAEKGQICADMLASSQVGYYDTVLIDIRMPVKNGYEATEMIRAMTDRANSSLPIVAMTADAFSDDIQRCLDHGMNAQVAKSIDVKEISRVLSKLMSRKKYRFDKF